MKADQKPQLIYLAFGADTYRTEAVFSIASALKHSAIAAQDRAFDIQVFTDNPAEFDQLPVITHSIADSWRGPHDYHFRIKHAVLQQVLSKHTIALLIDTDTFFKTSPTSLFERIPANGLLCNTIGVSLQDLGLQELLAAAKNIQPVIDTPLQLNSGVIGLTKKNVDVLDRSITLMDELQPAFRHIYTLEERCLAMAVTREMRLTECPDLIHHYWSRKEIFRAKITAWYRKHRHALLSTAALTDIAMLNDRLPRPRQPLRGLQKISTLLIPYEQRQFSREILYGCGCCSLNNELDRACASVWWDKAAKVLKQRKDHAPEYSKLAHWLKHPVLRLLAGRHYPQVVAHLTGTP